MFINFIKKVPCDIPLDLLHLNFQLFIVDVTLLKIVVGFIKFSVSFFIISYRQEFISFSVHFKILTYLNQLTLLNNSIDNFIWPEGNILPILLLLILMLLLLLQLLLILLFSLNSLIFILTNLMLLLKVFELLIDLLRCLWFHKISLFRPSFLQIDVRFYWIIWCATEEDSLLAALFLFIFLSSNWLCDIMRLTSK
mgnify:CR=1 FL=1